MLLDAYDWHAEVQKNGKQRQITAVVINKVS